MQPLLQSPRRTALAVFLLCAPALTGPAAPVSEEIGALDRLGPVTCMAFTPGGTQLAVAGGGATVRLLNPGTGAEIRQIQARGTISALAFDDTGRTLFAGGYNELSLWETLTGAYHDTFRERFGRITAMDTSPDGKTLAVAGRSVYLVDPAERKILGELPISGAAVGPLAFDATGKQLAAAAGARVALWDVGKRTVTRMFTGHRTAVVGMAFADDDTFLTVSADGALFVWKLAEASPVGSREEHGEGATSLALSRDRRLAATAGRDGAIILRDPADGAPLHAIRELNRKPEVVALSPDATRLACGLRSPGVDLYLWRLDPAALHAGYGSPVGGEFDVDYLTRQEAAVLVEQNRARQNPKMYAEYARDMLRRFDGNIYRHPNGSNIRTQEGVAAVREAIQYLEEVQPAPRLRSARGMCLAAADHVRDTGPKGVTGHAGADNSTPAQRLSRYGQWLKASGESIAYGTTDARRIVLQLIIDDGVPSRSHRHALFNPAFRVTGIHIGPHHTLRHMCVLTYSGGYKEK